MDAYPPSYVARPRPLVLLSGFATGPPVPPSEPERPFRYGPRLSSGSPLVDGELASRFLREFLAYDPGDRPTEADIKPMHFRVKAVGRVGQLQQHSKRVY